jgi:hypothetical protein
MRMRNLSDYEHNFDSTKSKIRRINKSRGEVLDERSFMENTEMMEEMVSTKNELFKR